jgi:hypothetical protein
MRTKTLLLAAAFSAVGAATAMAQVYSVNAVGYVNTALKKGFNLIANPLDAGADNTVAKLLPGSGWYGSSTPYAPGTGIQVNTLDLGEWTNPNATLVPGQGFFVRTPECRDGDVCRRSQTGQSLDPVGQGLQLGSLASAASGQIQHRLGFGLADGEQGLPLTQTPSNTNLHLDLVNGTLRTHDCGG